MRILSTLCLLIIILILNGCATSDKPSRINSPRVFISGVTESEVIIELKKSCGLAKRTLKPSDNHDLVCTEPLVRSDPVDRAFIANIRETFPTHPERLYIYYLSGRENGVWVGLTVKIDYQDFAEKTYTSYLTNQFLYRKWQEEFDSLKRKMEIN